MEVQDDPISFHMYTLIDKYVFISEGENWRPEPRHLLKFKFKHQFNHYEKKPP